MALVDAVKNVVAYRRTGGQDIDLVSVANRNSLDTSNLPFWDKDPFLNDVKEADDAFAAGSVPNAAAQAKAVNAFLRYISNVFSATVSKQDELIAAGKTKMIWLEDLPIDLDLVGAVNREAKKNVDTTFGAEAFKRLFDYADRNKANRAKVAEMLKAKGDAQAAAEVVADAGAIDQAIVAGGGSPDSSKGGILPKVLIAAAVIGVGYWFIRRNRR